jgi:hypothetical protein
MAHPHTSISLLAARSQIARGEELSNACANWSRRTRTMRRRPVWQPGADE